MTDLQLWGMHYSPWSQRARWALAHHGLAFTYHEHTPILGEVAARRRAGRWVGRVTVPQLLADGVPVGDSLAIAEWADAHGAGTPLIPAEHRAAVLDWVLRAERAMEAGRSLVVRALGQSADALAESAPPWIPPPLRRAVGLSGLPAFRLKYSLGQRTEAEDRAALTAFLDELAGALRARRGSPMGEAPATDGGRRTQGEPPATLLPGFTLADMAATGPVQVVRAAGRPWYDLGPATAETWHQPALVERYRELLAWRDALLEAHHAPRAPVRA